MSRPHCEGRPGSAVRIGDNVPRYYRYKEENIVKHGELFNISIENIYTRAFTAISVDATVKNLTARNIYVRNNGSFALSCGHYTHTDIMFPIFLTTVKFKRLNIFLMKKNPIILQPLKTY